MLQNFIYNKIYYLPTNIDNKDISKREKIYK